jgi:hypothetical protein
LEEATGQLGVEHAVRRGADTEVEALQSSAARDWDLLLEQVDEPSSLGRHYPR